MVKENNKTTISIFDVAMKGLDDILDSVDNSEIVVPKNIWSSMPKGLIHKGVIEISNLGITGEGNELNMIYFDEHSEMKFHYHDNRKELITMIKGFIMYKIYSDIDRKVLIEEGILHRWHQLTINEYHSHCVFTTTEKAYMAIEFIK